MFLPNSEYLIFTIVGIKIRPGAPGPGPCDGSAMLACTLWYTHLAVSDDAAVSGGGAFGCALLASGYADTFGLAARKGVRVPCIGFRKLRALEPPAKEDPKP